MEVENNIDYREWIIDFFKQESPPSGYGMKKALAKYLDVHKSFISQVLSGHRHLNLEQGIKVSSFMKLEKKGRDIFIALLNYQRAESAELKFYFQQQIEELKESRSSYSPEQEIKNYYHHLDQARYYSSWLNKAILMALKLPSINTIEQLADRLEMDQEAISEAIDFLKSCGMVTSFEGHFALTDKAQDFPMSMKYRAKNHLNWREKGIERLQGKQLNRDLFVTRPLLLSRAEIEYAKGRIIDLISELIQDNSFDQRTEMFCLNMDLFEI
jgi:uncharacterized protein (TIGR02147 family)